MANDLTRQQGKSVDDEALNAGCKVDVWEGSQEEEQRLLAAVRHAARTRMCVCQSPCRAGSQARHDTSWICWCGGASGRAPLQASTRWVWVLTTQCGRKAHMHQVEHEGSRVALKLQRPPCAWEFHVLRTLHERCPPPSRCLFGTALRLFNMPTSTALLLSLGRYGTLQDLVNGHLRAKVVCGTALVYAHTSSITCVLPTGSA